jgi:hypothetical protein
VSGSSFRALNQVNASGRKRSIASHPGALKVGFDMTSSKLSEDPATRGLQVWRATMVGELLDEEDYETIAEVLGG